MTRILKWISITLLLLVVSMAGLLFFWPRPTLLSDMSYSQAVYDSGGRLLRLTLSSDGKYRVFTSLSQVSQPVIEATLLQEDQYFYQHWGVNPISFARAIWQTYLLNGRRVGSSTITMQVARLRFGMNSKTVPGKILQILRAWQLEMHYSKDEILEAYFNLAPYGHNVEGIGAASYLYFAKPASALRLPEALTLAVIPQSPYQRMKSGDRALLQSIRQKLFLRRLMKHPEDTKYLPFMQLPLQISSLKSAPFHAPHFVNTVLMNTKKDQRVIVTSLDLSLQKIVERITKQYLARKNNLGVKNAAVLVLDTRDMGVKALLGSAGFLNHDIAGQLNGTQVKRSPGSSLKPFIYALALDQGLIHPATMLKDVPRSFGSYNPENFDYDFAGPLSAKEALVLSRNIPAVHLADQLKQPNLYEFLQASGVKDLKSQTHYGLALVLGGAELSMQELLKLYAMLANQGILRELQWIQGRSSFSGERLLSAEASFLILDMLKTENASFPVAWKTGTSSGFRDAWTVGVFGPYVMAVWLGNFDNQSNPALIGKELAAPLFFELVNAIRMHKKDLPTFEKNPAGLNLTKVELCKASGMLPTRYCTERETGWFIPGKSPIKTDTIFREVAINTKTNLRACQFDENTRFEIYEFWSSDLLKIFKQAGIARRLPPPYDANCKPIFNNGDGFSPQITSPQTQVNYVLHLKTHKAEWLPLNAVVDADVKYLHWFLNASYLGKTSCDKSFLWKMQPGRYIVRVVDDSGRSDARELNVEIAS